ncbi:DinB family protein [Lewinella sp. IMCC34191]|uniref:DinB family protein n=1 Tax=Lewinella sp. IMCC34191 TaxID=2259172 RepID=UPI000E267AA6|nr:DinB family protein [Lewinella sp. IMCC34191]
MDLGQELFVSYRKQFAYYRTLGQRAMDQLTFDELRADDQAGSNSIAVIVKHLSGNMKSRWTEFLTTDGEKPWRDREAEFIDDFADRAALQGAWNEGWTVVENAIVGLQAEQLTAIVYIRNEGHTVAEAINRQLAHYSYHIGQIVLLAKQIRGENWISLSIPRGDSARYNAEKFGREKQRKHFTDDWV